MRLGSTGRADGVRGDRAGGARVGIGTRGSTDSRLFQETEFSIAPSGGDFIRRGTYTARRFMDTATDATVMEGTTIITSARTWGTGGPETTPSPAGIIHGAPTPARARGGGGGS